MAADETCWVLGLEGGTDEVPSEQLGLSGSV